MGPLGLCLLRALAPHSSLAWTLVSSSTQLSTRDCQGGWWWLPCLWVTTPSQTTSCHVWDSIAVAHKPLACTPLPTTGLLPDPCTPRYVPVG